LRGKQENKNRSNTTSEMIGRLFSFLHVSDALDQLNDFYEVQISGQVQNDVGSQLIRNLSLVPKYFKRSLVNVSTVVIELSTDKH
jgi:hypothetical protein